MRSITRKTASRPLVPRAWTPSPPRALIAAAVTRTQLLVLALAALAAVIVGSIVRSGLWRRHRVALLGAGVLAGLLGLSRRLGWQELLVVAGAVALAVILVPARRR